MSDIDFSVSGQSPSNAAAHKGLVIVGASGAGKSSLLSLLRKSLADYPQVTFPVRLTTRSARPDDSPLENRTIDIAELDKLASAGKILMRWEKRIGAERREAYAFLQPCVSTAILGGNDELISNRESISPNQKILDEFFKIAVVCDPQVRRERLVRRSPQLAEVPEELKTRLEPSPDEVIEACDLVLDNTEGFKPEEIDRIKKLALLLSKKNG